ncbi:hypothetical protein D3C84_721120 [compost metagenome]
MAADALAREGDIAHFDAAAVQLRHFAVQLLAVAAVGVGEHGDMGLGRLLGREHDHLAGGDRVDLLGDRPALGLLGEVHRLAVLDLVEIALHQVLAVRAGVQHAAALELDLVDTGHRAFADGLDGQAELQGVEGLADGLIRVVGEAEGAGQAKGQAGDETSHAHGYSCRAADVRESAKPTTEAPGRSRRMPGGRRWRLALACVSLRPGRPWPVVRRGDAV